MNELVKKDGDDPERIPDPGDLIEIGQWYWCQNDQTRKWDWFGCVTHIGSNFVRLDNPDGEHYRIHLKDFGKEARREESPEGVIKGRMNLYQDTVQEKLGQIKEITARLGLDPGTTPDAQTSESRELSMLSSSMPDMKKYKKSLILAKEKTLPKLFEEVKEAHEHLATWMTARTIPMKAVSEGLEGAIEKINDRVFNVSLYAGLAEDIEKIADGAAAAASEKLHLFQRMHFMDEECLANYKHGGMEFSQIRDFDRWIAKPENRDRILPEPRSMVAFRVRRNVKYRQWDGDLASAYVIVRLQELDKLTFMYIRNGEKLFRMDCDLEFGEHIFPSAHQIDLTEPMMAKREIGSFADIVTRRNWESLCREYDEKRRLHDEFEKAHENDDRMKRPHNPHYYSSFHDPHREYEPFDKTSVYYDDMEEEVGKQIKYYNRIALILQGLFDRSDILHPHPPAKLWTPMGMEALVELVYDGAGALHFKEPPDFALYKEKVNESMGAGSFTIGQEDVWELRCGAQERNRWNGRGQAPERARPYGDPGPGFIGQIVDWHARKSAAIFRWTRERRSYGSYWDYRDKDKPIPCTITVPREKLFNVSGYKLGDFKQFYQDPRSRAKYLQWAPLLIAAEEWHAGNLDRKGELIKKAQKEKKPKKERKSK